MFTLLITGYLQRSLSKTHTFYFNGKIVSAISLAGFVFVIFVLIYHSIKSNTNFECWSLIFA